MNRFSIRVLALAMISTALVAAPIVSAYAAGSDNPSPPASGTKDKKKDKGSSIDDPKFLKGYRTAYATIYDRHDYASAIDQLKGARPGRPRRRCQPDRLLLSQARRLQAVAGLV